MGNMQDHMMVLMNVTLLELVAIIQQVLSQYVCSYSHWCKAIIHIFLHITISLYITSAYNHMHTCKISVLILDLQLGLILLFAAKVM